MSRVLNLLLLAGSAEASEIVAHLSGGAYRIDVLLSEPARGPGALALPGRLMPNPSASQIAAGLDRIDAVLDASHGFDARLSVAGQAAAKHRGLPFMSLQRPPWDLAENPLWQGAADVTGARQHITPDARVFAATGWASLEDFLPFPGARLLLRQTRARLRDMPDPLVEPVFSPPPYSVVGETALFRRLAIDMLICRNIGGDASRPKLDAATALGLPVVLIDRPPRPAMPQVADTQAALDWLATL
ncbi:precorrin-6A/cobalt-precorrin-6A reductase [Sulfitobacter aestuarii]|uniref:Precorrin-6A/cobalt-precorrin-6A reductase n=1 Tax=Sulfitobacter aestuarii TaxID=2161676 RepID=A0ABW5TZ17_9RHOB